MSKTINIGPTTPQVRLPVVRPGLVVRATQRLCTRLLDRTSGSNNSDFQLNGELGFLQSVLPPMKVVFDVGANVGEWTIAALRINPRRDPLLRTASRQLRCFE